MEEEGLLGCNGFVDFGLGFEGEGLGEKGVGAVILVEPFHGAGERVLGMSSVVSLSIVAARSADRGPGDVDVESKIQGILPFVVKGREVSLADVDGGVAGWPRMDWWTVAL
jgi:hypothetical protein